MLADGPSPHSTNPTPSFGESLRQWRSCRHVSQLDLSCETGVSARHISFLETGKSQPSREMVLRLARALEVPRRGQNALLLAAGFAPIHRERPLGHPSLEPAADGIEFLLRAHDPFPAFVIDRRWDVVRSNRSHRRMLELALGGRPVADPVNVLRLCFDPELLRPAIVDWDVVATLLLRRLDRQLAVPQADDALLTLYRELLEMPGVTALVDRPAEVGVDSLLVPFTIELGGLRLSWLTTLATFGTAFDMTLEEVTIELLYPVDEPTKAYALELEGREAETGVARG